MKYIEHISIPLSGHMQIKKNDTESASKTDQKTNSNFTEYTYLCSSCNKTFNVPAQKKINIYLKDQTIYIINKNENGNDLITEYDTQCLTEQSLNSPLQLSFFDEPLKDKSIQFRKEIYKNELIICPFCNYKGKIATSKNIVEYDIFSDDSKTIISQTIESEDKDFLPQKYWPAEYDFPLKASISFSHEHHNTTFELSDCNKKRIEYIADLRTNEQLSGFTLTNYINENDIIKEALVKRFEKLQDTKIPYDYSELNLEYFVLLTQFKGFPKNFYEFMPYECNTHTFEKSFQDIVKMLTDYNKVPELYKMLNFPNKKRFKKILFENPELFFYYREIKKLPFENYDILLKILSSEKLFEFLALLHNLPNINFFIYEVIYKKGEAMAWKFITKNFDFLPEIAGSYFIVSDDLRQELLQYGFDAICENGGLTKQSSFNLPVTRSHEHIIPDEQFGKYRFTALKNTDAYQKVASELNNCLSYEMYKSVFGISINGRYVAAIALDKDQIIEAKLKNNKDIETNEEISKVFSLWIEKHSLVCAYEEYEEEVEFI